MTKISWWQGTPYKKFWGQGTFFYNHQKLLERVLVMFIKGSSPELASSKEIFGNMPLTTLTKSVIEKGFGDKP